MYGVWYNVCWRQKLSALKWCCRVESRTRAYLRDWWIFQGDGESFYMKVYVYICLDVFMSNSMYVNNALICIYDYNYVCFRHISVMRQAIIILNVSFSQHFTHTNACI